MALEISEFDVSEYLDSPEVILAYLQAALDEGDHALLREVLGDIAKAKGMSEIAGKAQLNRQNLYRSLSKTGNPSFETIDKIMHVLGFKLTVEPMEDKVDQIAHA